MKIKNLLFITISSFLSLNVSATNDPPGIVTAISDEEITRQRVNLAKNTTGKGYGPQSPRDIDMVEGRNTISFSMAPAYSSMNLCNIHFHKNAEHKGGDFTTFAGNGNGLGYETGFKFSGKLSESDLAPITQDICPGTHGGLRPGDTIEVHYVHSSAKTKPGPSLGSCLNDSVSNPQLRVEAQVYVLVNNDDALDFTELTTLKEQSGFYQAVNIPVNTGQPVQYSGSTTGPGYNEQGSPYQVTWSVRPKTAKVNIKSVDNWCEKNIFNEDHAHGVRNLITNPELLSAIDS